MRKNAEVAVTLSSELFDRVKNEAKLLGVPLEWIVAAIVADTFNAESPQESLVAV